LRYAHVDIRRLFDALQRTAWKHGMVEPERMRHIVNDDGTHTIVLALQASEVHYERPKHLERPSWGASTPEGADGNQRR
jgi:hypothetical protein